MAENAAIDTSNETDSHLEPDTSLSDDLHDVIDRLEGEIEEEPQEQAEPEQPPEEAEAEVRSEWEETVVEDKPEPKSKIAPPVNWSPEQREHFKSLPEDVQELIHSREVEIATTMQHTAQERKLAQSFIQAVEPFRGLMAAEGVQDPIQAVRGLMSTTAQLAMGTQQQKARKIADLINHYGIDIQTLDSVLAGEQPQDQETDRIQQMINQRLAPFDQMMQQYQQNQQQSYQRAQQDAQQSVEQFGADPEHEFFNDVRYIMADFMDIAARNGQEMTMDEAYERACMAHKEVSKIITQRKIAAAGQEQNAAIGGKRAAASSISGRRSGGSDADADTDDSIRGIITAQLGSESGRI